MEVLGLSSKCTGRRHIVLMFGMGMIGSSVRDSLSNFGFRLISEIDFSWDISGKRTNAYLLIEALCIRELPNLDCVSLVWSAGVGGFHSTEDEARLENHSFIDTIEFVKELKNKLGRVQFNVHYLSSAGGLFEGQRVVDKRSIPTPQRPYGRLKLSQERMLQKSVPFDSLTIYRPSSVYGPMRQKSQKGLINNLIRNGRNGGVTVLDAHVMSLRDYVYSGDIGGFIARIINSKITKLDGQSIYYLVSARCSSIYEVVLKIERTLNLNLNVRYDESFGNNTNITFSDSVLPPGWAPSSLNVGIKQFLVGGNS